MTTVNGNLTDTTEQFAERMVGATDSASLAILLSIGHQTKAADAGFTDVTIHEIETDPFNYYYYVVRK